MPPKGGKGGGGKGGGGHHHHGGHRGGGFRGGFGPYWGGYGYGYPIEYPASEIFVVEAEDDEAKTRSMAYVMSLPKNQRAAAYMKLFGKPAPAAVLGDWPPYQYQNAGTGMSLDWRQRSGGMASPWTQPYEYRAGDTVALGGIFETKTMDLPFPGKPEIPPYGTPLGDCGCGCAGSGACASMGDVDVMSLVKPVAIGVGVYLLYKHFSKKRRR